jgi:4'-phosphopantetheinyl transferase
MVQSTGNLILREQEVDIWFARISDLLRTRTCAFLSTPEKLYAARCAPKRAAEFSAARGYVRQLLSLYDHRVIPSGWEFKFGPFGKPMLASQTQAEKLYFNVSHSGNLVLIALTRAGEIGVDIENCTLTALELETFAKTVLSETEITRLSQIHPAERRAHFFKIWTLKEAYLKALGSGLQVDPIQVCLGIGEWKGENAEDRHGPWFFSRLDTTPGFQAALAVRTANHLRLRVRAAV